MKPAGLKKELEDVALDIADEISRLGWTREGEFDDKNVARIVRAKLRHLNEGYEGMALRTRKLIEEGAHVRGGSNEKGAAQNRRENIQTMPGFSDECDLCRKCPDSYPTFTLWIGSYRARLMLHVCFSCGERLISVVDARLEDGRLRQNRGRKAPKWLKTV